MPPAVDRAAADPGRRRHRADIEGLRAVAVSLVVAYHAGWAALSGGFVGVDVFFVLSGFLITGLLSEELRRSGTIAFTRFYGRRARRLLPMATVVLVATAVAFSFVISPLSRATLGTDIRSAAMYVANWHFAIDSLNYLSDPSRSPVLHYWSLSVEEQFYIVWPLLLLVAARTLRRRRRTAQPSATPLIVALAAVGAGSLATCIVLTSSNEPFAYYGLHTRAWELAAGGLLALATPRVGTLPALVRQIAGWSGLVVVVASAVVIGSGTAFPGVAALAPVFGTVLIVGAGAAGTSGGVARLLAASPMTYVGRISYSWYLWHWPCLVFAGALTAGPEHGRDTAGVGAAHGWPALTAVAVSLALSVAGHHTIEDPVRRSAWLAAVRRRSLALGAGLTAMSVAVVGVVLPASSGAVSGPVTAVVGTFVRSPQGGTTAKSVSAVVRVRSSPGAEQSDFPRQTGHCYASYHATSAPADCLFGDPNGTVSIAVVGDSHAQQWFPALQAAAERQHWRLWMWTKTACPFVALRVRLPTFHDTYPWCDTWRQAVLQRLHEVGRLSAVVVANFSGSIRYPGRYGSSDGSPLTADAAVAAWGAAWSHTSAALSQDASRIVLLRDTPKPASDVPYCLAAHGNDVRSCSFPSTTGYVDVDRILAAERRTSSQQVGVLDMDDLICPSNPCPVLWSDGTIMYSDAHHLTTQMTAKLAPMLASRLGRLLPRRSRATSDRGVS